MWALFSAGQILHFNPTVRESAHKQSLATPGADEKVSLTEQRGPQSTTKVASTGNKGSLAPAPRISKASQGSTPESLILVLAQWRPLEGGGAHPGWLWTAHPQRGGVAAGSCLGALSFPDIPHRTPTTRGAADKGDTVHKGDTEAPLSESPWSGSLTTGLK